MYIKQEKSNVDLNKPCPKRADGIHKWGFTPNTMYCDNCKWIIPIVNLICEHCRRTNQFFRADLVPNSIGLVDIFECEYCNKRSSIQNMEIQ